MNIPLPCQPGDPCYGKYLMLPPGGPGCYVYTKSDDVIYIGTNLPNTGIKTGDCLTLALKKIDRSLIDFVKNEGGTPSIITNNGFPIFGTVGRLLVNTNDNNLYEDTGTGWQLIGSAPGNYIPYTGANQSIDLGYNSFQVNGVAITNQLNQNNVGIGQSNLVLNTTGLGNIAIGSTTLNSNTTGNYNVGIGSYSLQANQFGNDNVAIGNESMNQNLTGGSNVAIGNGSLYNMTTGLHNTSIGYFSLNNFVSGDNNIAIGPHSGDALINGSENIFIGVYAGNNINNGSDNIFIGNFVSTPDVSSNILIGTDAKGILLANFNTGYWQTPDSIQQTIDNGTVKNFLQSELTLGSGQVVIPSTTSTVNTTIKLTINGVDYYLLATTVAP